MKSNDASSALIAGSLLSLNGRTYSKNLLIHFDVVPDEGYTMKEVMSLESPVLITNIY